MYFLLASCLCYIQLPSTSTNSTYTTKVFDSQGKEHTLTQYFVKTGANTWDAHYYQGNTAVGGPQALTFGTNGTLTAPVTARSRPMS